MSTALTGGRTPADGNDPGSFPTIYNNEVVAHDGLIQAGEFLRVKATGNAGPDEAESYPYSKALGLTVVELSLGVWSSDAPAGRTNGESPILFIPFDPDNPTDPADPTNGIDTPANIRDWDRLGPTTAMSV